MNRHPAHILLLKAARALELLIAAVILLVIVCGAVFLFRETGTLQKSYVVVLRLFLKVKWKPAVAWVFHMVRQCKKSSCHKLFA